MRASRAYEAPVSIVIPTRSRPRFLRAALGSALNQTHTAVQVLVADNGGDEATRRVVSEAADDRVVHLVRERDLGMMRNAVLGFAAADGAYVMKLDDDDRLHPEAVRLLLAPLMADPGATLSFASFDLIDADGRRLPERTLANERYSGRAELSPGRHQPFDALVAAGPVGMAAALVRRDAVDWHAVPEQVDTAYDRHIALQACRDGAAVWFIARPLADYRLHPHSDSLIAPTRQLAGSLAAMEAAAADGRHVQTSVLRMQTGNTAERLTRQLLREGRSAQARAVALRGARHRPSPTLLRLLALGALPAPLGRQIARHRFQRHLRRAAIGGPNGYVPGA